MSDEDIFRIQRVSKRMKSLCTIVMVIMPIFFTSIWINFENLATGFSLLDGIPYQLTNLTWVHLVSGFAVSLVLAGVILYGMYRLRRLFELYSEGHVFTAENAKLYPWVRFVCHLVRDFESGGRDVVEHNFDHQQSAR